MNEKTGGPNPWPYAIIIFFVALVGLIVGFVAWSLQHSQDLVAEDYYERTLTYQDQIDRTVNAMELDPPTVIAFDASSRSIRIDLSTALPEGGGTVTLYRPSDAGQDQVYLLKAAPGEQVILHAAEADAGLWRIKLRWDGADGVSYYMEETAVLP